MIPLIKGQRKSKYDYRDSLPVNMTAVVEQIEGDTGYLLAHDGLKEFGTTSGKARGGYFNERLNTQFRVSGDQLETISTSGTATPVGTIAGVDACSFAESFNTQGIVSGGRFYLYDGYVLTQVADPDVGVPIDLTWFNGIYVLTDGNSLYHTKLANELQIDTLAYTSSEFAADPIKGLIRTDSNEIVAFNRFSTEYFYFNANAPTGASVLQRIDGKATRIGIVGTHCKAFLDGNIFILGGRKEESPSIHALSGGGVATIATREIDKVLAEYDESELETAFMESRTVDRDKFLIIHLPRHTLLYNHTVAQQAGTASAWSYLKTGQDSIWRARYGVFDARIGKWVYGDIQQDKLATLDSENFAQYDEEQELLFYTPIIPAKQMPLDKIELDTIPGFSNGELSAAVALSYDHVGWGSEVWVLTSQKFNYDQNFILRRLGYVARSFSMRFRMVSKDKMAFSGLTVNDSK